MTDFDEKQSNGSCLVRSVSGSLDGGWKRSGSVMASKKVVYKPKRSGFRAIWPHVLLIIILAGYIFGGALTFLHLEHPTEIKLKTKGIELVENQKQRLRDFVWSSLIASSIQISECPNSTWNSTSNSTFISSSNSSVSSNSSDSDPVLTLSLLDVILNNDTLNGTGASEQEMQWRAQFDEALGEYTRVVLRAMRDNFIEHSILFDDERRNEDLWTLPAAVLFAFSAVTTIGYGNIAPVTFKGRLFCIFYGLIGIPFAMLVLANVGKFLSEGLQHVVAISNRAWHRFKRKIQTRLSREKRTALIEEAKTSSDGSIGETSEDDPDKEIDKPLPFVCMIALVFGYICLGAVLLPYWESFSFFDAFYFNFVTITTTGFGDLVPQRFSFLAVTLIYVAVGIAMTTMCIEAAAAYMRKLHYVGRRIQGAKFTNIRFGDKMITVDELITSLGVKFGVPTTEVVRLKTKLDAFVATAIETKDLDEKTKAAALNSIDERSPDNRVPNGGVSAHIPGQRDADEDNWANVPFFPGFTGSLWRLLGAFNVSDEDIRYIDDDRVETVV